MKFRKFGKTVLTAALSSAIVFSLSSCVRSFTVGYLYVTGTVTATPSGNGIVTGFKIDNNTGNLRPLDGLPVSSGGANPVRAVLLSGGNFVYVLNRGTTASGGPNCTTTDPCQNSNIQEFVVGGNGILTPQETFFTQGRNPFRLISDTTGKFLLAMDHDAPASTYCPSVGATSGSCGDITVFAIDPSTGRLSLVTNAQLTSSSGSQVTYFPIPASPVDFTMASGFVYTLAGAPGTPQTYYAYTYNSTSGQLATTLNSATAVNNGEGAQMKQGTAIIFAGGRIYIPDVEPLSANGVTSPSQIVPLTINTTGALGSLVGGPVPNDPAETDPIYLIIESKGKFLYVANQQGASTATGAGIAGFTIDPSSSQLSETPGSPWGTGANPQCLLEDPSAQYIYTASSDSSSVTGKLLDPISGQLDAMRGSTGTFALKGPASWCVATGRTN
ncbi:beta-propeller fold lactonase family protein [Acidicapsa ligni]|uniref:beta-propeller fold lactonase family protein n=1 Tax=Acidicapsa ligni TaxID=542300 RepID=UPI0021E0496F|nr:beta-propeller fold lactonase family protein [Acidicapsa ligni]